MQELQYKRYGSRQVITPVEGEGQSKRYYLTRNGQLGITTLGEKTENHYQGVWSNFIDK